MGQILSGLVKNRKELVEGGVARVAEKFNVRVDAIIGSGRNGNYAVYFKDEIDEATGKKVTTTILPDYDSEGQPIVPDDVRVEPASQVILTVIDKDGKLTEDTVSGFILNSSIAGLPSGVSGIGLKALATGIRALRKHGKTSGKTGEDSFISRLDFNSNEPAIIAATSGLALYNRA